MEWHWHAYPVYLQLLSPVHIGWQRAGNLQQTRPYLPAWNLWGALTARLARQANIATEDQAGYKKMGELVEGNLRFTYFYPTMYFGNDAFDADKMLWPWDDQERFSWLFFASQASTALSAACTAEEGSLHDVEFIAPFTRAGDQVGLVGYVFSKPDFQLDWQSVLRQGLQLGGERTYGWGRVRAEWPLTELTINEPQVNCFGLKVELDAPEAPIIKLKQHTGVLLAHTLVDGVMDFEGPIERMVRRDTKDSRFFGRDIKVNVPCWMPGSKSRLQADFGINGQGVWYQYTR